MRTGRSSPARPGRQGTATVRRGERGSSCRRHNRRRREVAPTGRAESVTVIVVVVTVAATSASGLLGGLRRLDRPLQGRLRAFRRPSRCWGVLVVARLPVSVASVVVTESGDRSGCREQGDDQDGSALARNGSYRGTGWPAAYAEAGTTARWRRLSPPAGWSAHQRYLSAPVPRRSARRRTPADPPASPPGYAAPAAGCRGDS